MRQRIGFEYIYDEATRLLDEHPDAEHNCGRSSVILMIMAFMWWTKQGDAAVVGLTVESQ
jgi:hypothetical protein